MLLALCLCTFVLYSFHLPLSPVRFKKDNFISAPKIINHSFGLKQPIISKEKSSSENKQADHSQAKVFHVHLRFESQLCIGLEVHIPPSCHAYTHAFSWTLPRGCHQCNEDTGMCMHAYMHNQRTNILRIKRPRSESRGWPGEAPGGGRLISVSSMRF